jgi:hypothetical protein
VDECKPLPRRRPRTPARPPPRCRARAKFEPPVILDTDCDRLISVDPEHLDSEVFLAARVCDNVFATCAMGDLTQDVPLTLQQCAVTAMTSLVDRLSCPTQTNNIINQFGLHPSRWFPRLIPFESSHSIPQRCVAWIRRLLRVRPRRAEHRGGDQRIGQHLQRELQCCACFHCFIFGWLLAGEGVVKGGGGLDAQVFWGARGRRRCEVCGPRSAAHGRVKSVERSAGTAPHRPAATEDRKLENRSARSVGSHASRQSVPRLFFGGELSNNIHTPRARHRQNAPAARNDPGSEYAPINCSVANDLIGARPGARDGDGDGERGERHR